MVLLSNKQLHRVEYFLCAALLCCTKLPHHASNPAGAQKPRNKKAYHQQPIFFQGK